MSNADKAMGDIDKAASPSSISSPNNPDNASKFITDSIYNSETPKSMAQDVTTTISMEDCSGDQILCERKMDNAQQLAHRMRPYNAAKPNTDTTLPDFQAGEIEYD